MKSIKCVIAVAALLSSALVVADAPRHVQCHLTGLSGANQRRTKVDVIKRIEFQPTTITPQATHSGTAVAILTEGRLALLTVNLLDNASAPYRYSLELQIYNQGAIANPDTPAAEAKVSSLPASITLAERAHDEKMGDFSATLQMQCE